MADEKKQEEKPTEASWFSHPDPFVEFVWTMLTLLLFVYLINEILIMISSGKFVILGYELPTRQILIDFFARIFSFYKIIAFILSVVFIGFIVYLYKNLVKLRTEEAKLLYPEVSRVKMENELKNPQWQKIINHLESLNESDWRLAILEADIMLNSLLDNMGLSGETMADKLRSVEKSDFTTVDNAWEAHKVRNQIAHEGGTFILSQHEARRVIGLYQTVFEEFRII